MPFTYMLQCSDGTYYVGSTFDLDRRVAQHQNGEGAAYTRTRRPVRLVWVAEYDSIREAYLAEKQIQGWNHDKRRALVEGRYADLPQLARTSRNRRDGRMPGD
ncbi:GIY-YIG nuclease family protein [Nocardioides sp. GCM10027113]|uniref:GIY-YIG nuclease family protein n=1 Tax=unclassified Nocardioides TaxID=2615069 RepID=UPI00360FD77A